MVLKLEQWFYTLPSSVRVTLCPDGKKEGDEICRALSAFEAEAEIKGSLNISGGNPPQVGRQYRIANLAVRLEEDAFELFLMRRLRVRLPWQSRERLEVERFDFEALCMQNR